MTPITAPEKTNLHTFSNTESVENVYNRDGLTPLETDLVHRLLPAPCSVLDIGCGTGRTTMPLAQSGHKVVGIDYSPEMIRFAKQKYPNLDFRVMNACSLEFPDSEFDCALFSFNGIDYIWPYAKRLECIAEIYRVLRRRGLFVYSSHNAFCLPTTRILLGMMRRNLLSLRLFGRYREEASATGPLITFYGIPWVEKRTLRRMGFAPIEVTGRKYRSEPLVSLLELSPYYVMQKM